MKKVMLILLLTAATFSANTQSNASGITEPCSDELIMNVKGSWKKRSDALMKPGNQAAVTSRIDNIGKLFQTAYSSPKGIEAGWYRTMTYEPIVSNGPIGYAYNSLYKTWYCNKNVHQMLLGSETGTWAYVFVNYFSWFLYDTLSFRVNGQRLYRFPQAKGEWKGYTLYDAPAHPGQGLCIILFRNGQLPWKNVTQREYLESLRAFWVKKREEGNGVYARTMAGWQAGITSIQKNQYLSAADKEKGIANLQRSINQFQSTRAGDSIKATGYWNDRIAIIDTYLSRTDTATLQQSARLSNKDIGDFKGNFATGPKTSELVIINNSYFNKQLPTQSPQLMVLYWRWDDNAPARDFKQQLESNFPVERLQAMIDK